MTMSKTAASREFEDVIGSFTRFDDPGNQSRFNGFTNAPWLKTLFPSTADTSGNNSMLVQRGNNNPFPPPDSRPLQCFECKLIKNGIDEMEVHIRVDHLNWLPFQCPYCGTERPSDNQIREHIFCSHKKHANKFIYTDNPIAKRAMQVMMERILCSVRDSPSTVANNNVSNSPEKNPGVNGGHMNEPTESVFVTTSPPPEPGIQSRPDTSGNNNNTVPTMSRMDRINEIANELRQARRTGRKRPGYSRPPERIDTDSPQPAGSSSRQSSNSGPIVEEVDESITATTTEENKSPMLFSRSSTSSSKRVKSENAQFSYMDKIAHGIVREEVPISMVVDHHRLIDTSMPPLEEDEVPEETEVYSNMANRRFASTRPIRRVLPNGRKSLPTPTLLKRLIVEKLGLILNYSTPGVPLRKQAGKCNKCNKQITHGARTMHMFYHMARDYQIYRFKCLYDNCTVQYYRKDQMETHQAKEHGITDHHMILDRSQELFETVQELSSELLGTTVSAVPQQYTRSAANVAAHARRSGHSRGHRFRRSAPVEHHLENGMETEELGEDQPGDEDPYSPAIANASPSRRGRLEPAFSLRGVGADTQGNIFCKLCNKMMQNRIRGFHVLWHLAHDRGISRYGCRFCSFGHERSQSVTTHGRREHGLDDCIEDRIETYSEDVKQMSMECFGYAALFTSDPRKRSKIPLAGHERPPLFDPTEMGDEDDEFSAKANGGNSYMNNSRSNPLHRTAAAVVRRQRRFGNRRAQSRNKRREVVKLRELSMKLGGAQYFKKKMNETVVCEVCNIKTSRLSDHAYKHLNEHLFLCPHCDIGHYLRDSVVKHIRDLHGRTDAPVDDRLRFAAAIKETIRQCFPHHFIDAPLPNVEEFDIPTAIEENNGNEEEEDYDGLQLDNGIEPIDGNGYNEEDEVVDEVVYEEDGEEEDDDPYGQEQYPDDNGLMMDDE